MEKKEKRDTFGLELLLIISIIICAFSAVVYGSQNIAIKAEFATTAAEMRLCVESMKSSVLDYLNDIQDKYRLIAAQLDKNTKNINYLIHQRNVEREKIKRLEAQMELLLCKEDKYCSI